MEEICFMGDDVNDSSALAIAGLSACPADARAAIRSQCQVITKLRGGQGAVREVVDMLLASAAASASRNTLETR
jgi:3-deoxy-D-manno-octulosonate 8-phosphate phosphatase (KDO 8-P phosphatase)